MCRCSHPQQGSMRFNLFPFPSGVVVDRWQGHIHNQQRCFCEGSHLKQNCLLSGHTMSQTFITQFLTNSTSVLAWMPDERSPAHNILGREVRSGVAPLGRNYLLTKIWEDIDRPIKLSGRALYDDGQMINRNVINHVTKELLG